jgi:hypothetical protein
MTNVIAKKFSDKGRHDMRASDTNSVPVGTVY